MSRCLQPIVTCVLLRRVVLPVAACQSENRTMPELTSFQIVQLVVFLACIGAYTIAAAIWDIRIKKIPNKLTLPVFGLGIVYQLTFNGLADGVLGFALGFGLLFLLWMVGGGGGGDVKLMGGLAVWLGFELTGMVLIASTVCAGTCTFFVIVYSSLTRGVMKTKDIYTATGKTPKGKKPKKETQEQKARRRTMGYAVPVALATWAIVVWRLPEFPWMG